MLLISDVSTDPTLTQLNPSARKAFLDAVGHCMRFSTDLMAPRELQNVDPAAIDEWESAKLAQRLPFGHLRMLGRPELWDFDPLVAH